jgi:hypothetical protein
MSMGGGPRVPYSIYVSSHPKAKHERSIGHPKSYAEISLIHRLRVVRSQLLNLDIWFLIQCLASKYIKNLGC